MKKTVLIGLDLGTQGVRAMMTDTTGQVLGSASRRYEKINVSGCGGKEQDAEDWAQAAMQVLAELAGTCRDRLAGAKVCLAVDGTSGTILPLDKENRPLRTALMYNDGRAGSAVPEVHEKAAGLEEIMGYRMGSSFALPKIVWIRDEQPELFACTAAFVHQTDYIVGRLCGEYRVTDYANALKTGYDLLEERWDEKLLGELGLDAALFPRVVSPGTPIGRILPEAAEATGLPAGTMIAAGATDGYAACIASGVVRPGQYSSTIGTTLVLKGVTKEFIRDPEGRVYCHKHPEGYWYPGGAGNVGGLCLNTWFDETRFEEFNAQVPDVTPTGNILYPLLSEGERFPFAAPQAQGFSVIRDDRLTARYAGTMEGVAYTEKLCFDTLASLGCEIGEEIMITGGAVKAPVWSQIRADVLGKCMAEPAVAETAFGTALLAGTLSLGRSLPEAVEDMVSISRVFEPHEAARRQYEAYYEEFCGICREKGYL